MIKLEISVHVNRPVAEVFEYMSNPTKWPEWASTTEEATPSETPLKVGTRIRSRVRFLGRKIEGSSEVVEYEPNRRFVLRMDEPFPIKQTTTFQAENGGTGLFTAGEAELGGFFKLSEPILTRILKNQFQAQYETAKELLEARAPAET
jgi:uncharacterized protein YndB with AHSA1/START domain